MHNAVLPLNGTPLRRFLDAMLQQTMRAHPEFVQDVGHHGLLIMANALRALGWGVKMKEMPAPIREYAGRVAFYYIGDHSLEAAIGEDFNE